MNGTEIHGVSFYLLQLDDCGRKQQNLAPFNPTLTLPSRRIGKSFYPIICQGGSVKIERAYTANPWKEEEDPGDEASRFGHKMNEDEVGTEPVLMKKTDGSESWILNLRSKLSKIIVFECIPRVSFFGGLFVDWGC